MEVHSIPSFMKLNFVHGSTLHSQEITFVYETNLRSWQYTPFSYSQEIIFVYESKLRLQK
jgi:hypothetical protein